MRAETSYSCGAVVNRKSRRIGKAGAETEVHAKADRAKANGGATRVGLKPAGDWHKRNFLTEVLIPSIFMRRGDGHHNVLFPELLGEQIGLTWIGHASFLLQIAGLNVLIDPNWAMWLKVFKRIKKPGISIHDLPNIDLVLVTHAHFDHLDRRTLRMVAAEQPIIVPFGVGNLVHDLGFNQVHEVNYWEAVEHGPLKITLTPCHHWGARVLHDSHRGFGGFFIESGPRSVFHCGDSAYFDGFREIGERCNIELALLPIGAYDPPSGREVHMNPEQAVQTFLELGANWMVPMHYGSFRLSFEPVEEPLQRLIRSAKELGVAEKLCVMTEGKPQIF